MKEVSDAVEQCQACTLHNTEKVTVGESRDHPLHEGGGSCSGSVMHVPVHCTVQR